MRQNKTRLRVSKALSCILKEGRTRQVPKKSSMYTLQRDITQFSTPSELPNMKQRKMTRLNAPLPSPTAGPACMCSNRTTRYFKGCDARQTSFLSGSPPPPPPPSPPRGKNTADDVFGHCLQPQFSYRRINFTPRDCLPLA